MARVQVRRNERLLLLLRAWLSVLVQRLLSLLLVLILFSTTQVVLDRVVNVYRRETISISSARRKVDVRQTAHGPKAKREIVPVARSSTENPGLRKCVGGRFRHRAGSRRVRFVRADLEIGTRMACNRCTMTGTRTHRSRRTRVLYGPGHQSSIQPTIGPNGRGRREHAGLLKREPSIGRTGERCRGAVREWLAVVV